MVVVQHGCAVEMLAGGIIVLPVKAKEMGKIKRFDDS
jgi:hypothetical protein